VPGGFPSRRRCSTDFGSGPFMPQPPGKKTVAPARRCVAWPRWSRRREQEAPCARALPPPLPASWLWRDTGRAMSQENFRRRKTVQGLMIAACLACAGLAIGDMLRSLRRHS
jgi:hypothetical protein